MKKQVFATVTSRQAAGDEPSITISTIALDRDRDEIVPEGGDFSAYLRNPVVLFGHDTRSLPVGTTTALAVEPGRGIRATWQWLEGDPFAERVRNAFEQGVLRAASVGFMPKESERNTQGGARFTKWQLLEWSLVAVPANPEAVRTLKGLGLWDESGRRCDDDETVLELVGEPDATDDDIAVDFDDEELAASIQASLRASRHRAEQTLDGIDLREVADLAQQHAQAEFRAVLADVVQREVKRAVAKLQGKMDFTHSGQVHLVRYDT